MSSPTVPTPAPEPSDDDRVAARCEPRLEEDLGSLVLVCYCRRATGYPFLMTHPDGLYSGTEPEVLAAFAAHRAECEAR